MYILKPKVFFCYTLRDNNINFSLLNNLKNNMNLLNLFYTYIDLIDNNATDYQQDVIKNLKCSDILCIINTPKIYESPWVKKEIHYANKFNIPIIKIDLTSIYSFIDTTDTKELICSSLIIKIIQTVLHNRLI